MLSSPGGASSSSQRKAKLEALNEVFFSVLSVPSVVKDFLELVTPHARNEIG
jgi:hypothetical protein